MVQAVQKIERGIRERRDTDIKLVNYWLYLFLLSGITLGIYPLVLFFKRIKRIDGFIQRKKDYYEGVIEFTEKFSKEKNKYDEYHDQINDLKEFYEDVFSKQIKEINAGLSMVLTIVTCGLYGIFVYYRQNNIWDKLQRFEQDFNDKLNQIWMKLELIKYPLSFRIDSSKNRNYFINLLLSWISFGIWGIVWDYKIHTDPDTLYKEYHSVEDTVLNAVRQ